MAYGTDNTFNLESGIGAKLNGDVLNWLVENSLDKQLTLDKIVSSAWYQGDNVKYGVAYTDTLKKSNKVEGNAKVGLIQFGDILASQSSTLLTKKYTVTSSSDNTKIYWTMNRHSNGSNVYYVNSTGDVNNNSFSFASGLRPVIIVKPDLTISGGNGTWKNPYQI